jgi:hypothetical protein
MAARIGSAARVAVTVAAVGFAVGFAAVNAASAQAPAHSSVTTDPRWTPWLGCWQSDTAGLRGTSASPGVTCVTPVAGSASVDAESIVGGQIVSHRHLIADGKPHSIDESGCHGDETANWSATAQRIYLRADYTCAAGLKGSSSSVFAMSPSGEWIEVQNVRADGGSIDRVLRWRETSPPIGLSKSVASELTGRGLSIATARAAASRPLTTDDVIEAIRSVDAATVRSWILVTGERFDLGDTQLAALDRADVPPSVIRAMTGADQATDAAASDDAQRSADDYLRGYTMGEEAYGAAPVTSNPYSDYNGYGGSYTPYPGYPYGSYGYGSYGHGYGGVPIVGYPITTPIIVMHGGTRGYPINGGHGMTGTPPGVRPPMIHPPVGRPIGARPPTAPPPVAHVPVAHAAAPPSPVARVEVRPRP